MGNPQPGAERADGFSFARGRLAQAVIDRRGMKRGPSGLLRPIVQQGKQGNGIWAARDRNQQARFTREPGEERSRLAG